MIKHSRTIRLANRFIASVIILTFCLGQVFPSPAHAQVLNLPVPGTMIFASEAFTPVILRGVKVNPENPFQFDFIVDSGNTVLQGDALKDESEKIIHYFLAALTIPEGEMWVNLSPHEKDRILTEAFGQTEMGRDLLAQDYILKQLTATLLHPDKDLGDRFWKRVNQKAQELYGTENISTDTFHKVWILPDRAEILQQDNTALVVDAHLKVMLETDYLAVQDNRSPSHQVTKSPEIDNGGQKMGNGKNPSSVLHHPSSLEKMESSRDLGGEGTRDLSESIMREVILPAIEREVNEGKNFAPLRQVYNSAILAAWYKQALKQSLLNQIYADQKKIDGVNVDDVTIKEKIYQQYLDAYQKGVFDLIKEERGDNFDEAIPRRYFSGGVEWNISDEAMIVTDPAQLTPRGQEGLKNLQEKIGDLSLARILLGKVTNEGKRIANIIRRHAKDIVTAPLMVSLAFAPLQGAAFTQDSLDLVQQNTAYYYADAPQADQITVRSVDRNLDDMLVQYKREQGGLIPDYLEVPHFKQVVERLGLDAVVSFDALAQDLKEEFSKQYKSGGSAGALELETMEWVMDFLVTTTSYDHEGVAARDGKFMALYRLFFGKETDPDGKRVHVCSSISEAAVILMAGEFGVRKEAVKTHEVLVGADGKKYPDKDGLGHAVVSLSTIDGKQYSFDQSNEPMRRPHKVVMEGETLTQITETMQAMNEYQRILNAYNENVDRNNAGEDVLAEVKSLSEDVSVLLKNPTLQRHADLQESVDDIARLIKLSLEQTNGMQVFNSIIDDLRQTDERAHEAFEKGQWQEAERLFLQVKRGAEQQAEFLSPILQGMDGFENENGEALTAADIIQNLKQFARVAEGNAKAAESKYRSAEKEQQFNVYKDYEQRFNDLVGNKTISSGQAPGIIRQLRSQRSDIKEQLVDRNLFPETRGFYQELMDAIDHTIARLSGQDGQSPVSVAKQASGEIVIKASESDSVDQFNAFAAEFNRISGKRAISEAEAPGAKKGLEGLLVRVKTKQDAGVPSALEPMYKQLIQKLERSIERMDKFITQAGSKQAQFQEYKALETRLKNMLHGKAISSSEFGRLSQELQEIKAEAQQNLNTQGLDSQIKGFYEGLIRDIDSILKKISLGPEGTNNAPPAMLAQADEAMAVAEQDAVTNEAWNTGGVDLNHLTITVRGDENGFDASVLLLENFDFDASTNFSGLMIQSMSITPIIDFKLMF